MQYYELSVQINSSNPDIRDYERYILQVKDLWDVEIFHCFEYGEIHKKLHFHALVMRSDELHPLRRCNMPLPAKHGYSVSFSKCRSRFAWDQYYKKHIENQIDILDYEYSKSVKTRIDIRKLK